MRKFYYLFAILMLASLNSTAQQLTSAEQAEIYAANQALLTNSLQTNPNLGGFEYGNLNTNEIFIPTSGATETFNPAVGDLFYDTGGPGGSSTSGTAGNYPNCGCDTFTTLAGVTEIKFNFFSVFGNFDYLQIYDGTDSSGTLLYDNGLGGPNDGDITLNDMIASHGSDTFTGTSGSFYFVFHSSTVVDYGGWEVEILAASGGGGGDELLIVDLTTENQVTITATTNASVATVEGSTTTGFYFENLFSNTGEQAIGVTTPVGTPTLTAASVPTDNSPLMFRFGSTDPGLNIYSYSATTPTTFTTGEQAFTGEVTWTITPELYAAMLTAPESGNVYFPGDDVTDLGAATMLGTYTVILPGGDPEPGDGCEWTVIVQDDDYWGDEVSWELRDASNAVLLSGGDYGDGYYDEQTVTAEGALTFYIEAMGTFNDNSPTYTVSNGVETVVSGSLSGGDEATYTDLVCGDGDPEPSGDCSGPASIIHDDGNIENGASGNPASVSQMEFVNKFTPVGYPATIESVCSSFITVAGGTPDLFYDIVVY